MSDFWTRLAEAQGEFGKAILDEENPQQGYRYASYASLIEAVKPALASRGIAIIHDIDEDDVFRMDSFQGFRQWVAVRTILKAADGEHDSGLVRVPVQGRWMRGGEMRQEAGVQEYGGAITYAKRYGLELALGISREDESSVDKQDRPTGDAEQRPRQSRERRQERRQEQPQEQVYEITSAIRSYWERKKPEEFFGEFQRLSKTHGRYAALTYHAWLEERGYAFDQNSKAYVPIDSGDADTEAETAGEEQQSEEGQ